MEKNIIKRFGAWTVESDGTLECESTGYVIDGSRIDEPGQNWLAHMARKRWVNMSDFTIAYFTACQARGIGVVAIDTSRIW